ncbi:neuronal acetylcholine receptor subunit alpha-10 [Exaiptasia diaphana]|uniref:Uncharacterized protein n=1 Tax=Exaiptasia diaphana TaxID=2652724 RepID=A0A913YR12_EXADI|nr:neuronal acetylcholine receptor subunit alpha-10 [Exaiptasia diaphana]XP_028517488.1 neuronal acetylcholine receptor subunit alpha-10 [Exaiptasia diaphana]
MVTKKKGFYLTVFGMMLVICRGYCFGEPQSPEEKDFVDGQERLFQKFLNKSNNRVRSIPISSNNKSVIVEFGYVVINIVEVNAKAQFIRMYGWVSQRWNNSRLTWNPADFGGVDEIAVRPNEVWVPDILLYNNIDHQDRHAGGRNSYKTDVVVKSTGENFWHNPSLFKLVCQISVIYFPLDEQNCTLKFGSWTQDNSRLQLRPMPIKFPSTYYTENGEWTVTKMWMCRKRKKYQCCQRKFDHIEFFIKMRRNASDYLINLIIPCCLISSMIFLGFILPPESGERIGLSITVLLAMTVFQQLTSEIMPSYDFPILGQYYFAIVLEISTSIVATTLILNFYHRTHRQMPYLIRRVVLEWTSRLVFLHDEVKKMYGKNNRRTNEENRVNLESKYDNKAKDSQRKSFRATTRRGRARTEGATGLELEHFDKYSDISERYSAEQNADTDTTQTLYGINVYPKFNIATGKSGDVREGKTFTGCCTDDSQDISDEERDLRKCEWTLAARILDRFVLVLSIVIGVVTVSAVFLRAPALWSFEKDISDLAHPAQDITKNCTKDE